uniref:Uncharacterized protein n=1 Tax=Oryza punctata TaxID=4537 RepID=A0A0E0KQD6_ORYPU
MQNGLLKKVYEFSVLYDAKESPVHGPRELGISGVRCIAVSEVFVVRSVLVGEADNESNNTITMVLREAATMVPQD